MSETKETQLDFLEDLMNDAAKAAMQDEKNWRECSPDNPPCAICKRIITRGCPLRAFQGEGLNIREIAFHDTCMFKEGTLQDDPNDDEVHGCDSIIECVVCEQLSTCPHLSDEERKRLTKEREKT